MERPEHWVVNGVGRRVPTQLNGKAYQAFGVEPLRPEGRMAGASIPFFADSPGDGDKRVASLTEALDKNKYLLVHQLPRQIANRGIRSVIIAPILVDKECHGVVYIENSKEHPHYSLPDMDYLILLTINIGYMISKMP